MTETMSAEWEKWLELEKTNVEVLEKQIEEMVSKHDTPEGFLYRQFWDEAKEISGTLETVTPIPQDEKDRLLHMHKRACNEVKRRQDKEYQSRRADWQERKGQSSKVRAVIEEKIDQARAMAEADLTDMEALSRSQAILAEALAIMKGKKIDGEPAEGETQKGNGLLREDNQACWEKWRELNDMVFSSRQTVWDSNYEKVKAEAEQALADASGGDSFHVLDKVKEIQAFMKDNPLSRSQREEVRKILNNAWEIAIKKVNTIRAEKKQKFENWVDQMQSQLSRMENFLQKNKEEAADIDDQIKRLQAEIRAGRSPEYSATVKEWIGEKRKRAEVVAAESRSVEEKIAALKERMSGNSGKDNGDQPQETGGEADD